jgi:hypothetical protein
MRKTIFSAVLFITAVMLFNSCQKEVSKISNIVQLDQGLIVKINSWLDQQKPVGKPNKTANIELLKQSLDFDHANYEQLNQEKRILVVSIKDKYKTSKNVDKNTILNLVLIFNKQENIISGNLVSYIPEIGKPIDKLPENTFSKIYTGKSIECSGKFNFQSPSGFLRFQFGYTEGNFSSYGRIGKKNDDSISNNANSASRTEFCGNAYLIVDWYYNGTYIGTTYEYMGYVCIGCDEPNLQQICPDDGGGSANDENACFNSKLSEFEQNAANEIEASDPSNYAVIDIDEFTKHKDPKWVCLYGNGFTLISQEIGVVKLVDQSNNTWAWKSLTHSGGGIFMNGTPPPTNSVSFSQGVGTPSFTEENGNQYNNIYYAGMSLNFTVTNRFVCDCPGFPVVGWVPPITKFYTSNKLWSANPYVND